MKRSGDITLQWVHGPITVVMETKRTNEAECIRASMGPRSDNRGYVEMEIRNDLSELASMGPRSDNRGYASGTG